MNGLFAVACRTDNLDGRVGREDVSKKVPYDLGIFNDENLDQGSGIGVRESGINLYRGSGIGRISRRRKEKSSGRY